MLNLILNIVNLMALNKRVFVAVTVLALVVLAVALFAVSPDAVLAGPATANSACGTCGG